jgi:uncharacterized protein DUF4190/putative regulator of septum formation
VSQPPYGPEPDRPQDRPQDAPRSFPTYGRPDQPHAQQPHAQQPHAQQPGGQLPGSQQFGAQPSYGQSAQPSYGQSGQSNGQTGQQAGATQWAAPGQPQHAHLAGQSPYGQSAYGQTQYAQSPYGQTQYGQPAGQAQYGQGYGQPGYPAGGTWPAPYGYGYPGTTRGTNGLATAALVTGIGGFLVGISAPVAVGLGIAALVQIRKRQEGGKGQAIAGLVLGALVTIGWAIFFAAMIVFASSEDDYYGAPPPGSHSTPVPTTTYSTDPTTTVDDMVVGECFDEGDDEDEAVRQPCNQPHDAEIIADVTLPAGAYPGDSGVKRAAETSCDAEFSRYVGKTVDESELEPGNWWPTEGLWNDNDRVVVCAAYGPDYDQLTETVKRSQR